MPPRQKPGYEREHAKKLARDWGADEKLTDEACQLCPYPLNPPSAGEEATVEYERAVEYIMEFCLSGDETYRDEKRAQGAEKQPPNLGVGTRETPSAGGATPPVGAPAKRPKVLHGDDVMVPRSSTTPVLQGAAGQTSLAPINSDTPASASDLGCDPPQSFKAKMNSVIGHWQAKRAEDFDAIFAEHTAERQKYEGKVRAWHDAMEEAQAQAAAAAKKEAEDRAKAADARTSADCSMGARIHEQQQKQMADTAEAEAKFKDLERFEAPQRDEWICSWIVRGNLCNTRNHVAMDFCRNPECRRSQIGGAMPMNRQRTTRAPRSTGGE